MPDYLGQTVGQDFLDMICRVFRGGYAATHPLHEEAPQDDASLVTLLEQTVTMGGPDADAMGRYMGNPDAPDTPGVGGQGVQPIPFAGVVGRWGDIPEELTLGNVPVEPEA
jgi:hypothetical protein